MTETSTASAPIHVSGVLNALETESRRRRVICLTLAVLMAAAFFLVNHQFWVPAHPGVDQNGYLVGGRLIAETGSMALRPRSVDTGAIDPFQFVGRMWVGFDLGTENERYLPKYPVGLPLIYAGALKLGGAAHGLDLVYLISPIAMAISLIGIHLLARLLLGSIPALAITLLVATSPVTLSLVNNPNSHAATLFLVIWGMYLAVRWWLMGGLWTALLSGLLVGSAVSIRYSEGLLILPLALVALFRLNQTRWSNQTLSQSFALFVGWAAPVVALLWHNRVAMGAWTGYDPTNESTGFAWKYFIENWDTMLRLMYQTGMTLVFPMAVGGLAAGFVWNWRVAAFLGSWVVPCLLLYTAYYWAPEGLNIGYTRFFLTIFPALGICAFGLLFWPVSHLPSCDEVVRRRLKLGATFALSLITLVSIPLGIANIQQSVQADFASKQNLQARALKVLESVPAGSVVVSDDNSLAHHLQMVGDYVLYTPEVFMRANLDRFSEQDENEPAGLHPGRVKHLLSIVDGMTQSQLDNLRDDVIAGALESGRRVYVFTQTGNVGGQGIRAQNLGRRPPGFRGMNLRRFELLPVYSGEDPVAMPRNNPFARWGMAPMGRNRTPATMPVATWQLQEITLRPSGAQAQGR